jgi:hypothetical protein
MANRDVPRLHPEWWSSNHPYTDLTVYREMAAAG